MPPKKSKSKTPDPAPPQASPVTKKSNSRKNIVKSGNAGSSKPTSSNNSGGASTDPQAAEKKSIFGDWTGKTPVSLLHEHCQRQGWEKPIYDMTRKKQGFIGTVQLGKRNKKTAQIQTITLTPEDLALPTALEARHLAATFALHRVNSHMPMHRVLPPQFRDAWHHFEKLKTKDNAWQYVPDPFGAQPPAAAKQSTIDRRIAKEHANAAVPMPAQSQKQRSSLSAMRMDDENEKPEYRPANTALDEKMRKYWESLPAVHMSAENRSLVEDVIKKSNIAYQPVTKELSKGEQDKISADLVRMGFRPSHVNEALEYSSDLAMALDWLYLPSAFMHANYNPTMTTISHTTKSLGRDWLIKKMTSVGYASEVCEQAMEQMGDDVTKALALLQWRLVHGSDDDSGDNAAALPSINDFDKEELEMLRQEEAVALEAIYGPKFESKASEKDDQEQYTIELVAKMVSHRTQKTREVPVMLEVIIPRDSAYPHVPPIFTVNCDKLPAYLKLAMIRGLVLEAEANIGLPMVYMCAEWLQDKMDHLIANPPKLRDISQAVTSVPESNKKRKTIPSKSNYKKPRSMSAEEQAQVSAQLKTELDAMHASAAYQPFGKVRSKLPANDFKHEILKAVRQNQITIVSGETGCGKTTQVPQFILDDAITSGQGAMCNIICTQPRKVAAIGVAERVAVERCEKIGQSIGYAVRGETKSSPKTRLQFVTTGVLLRRLHSDLDLTGISHVMIDEVHERSVDSDFLLIILRRVLQRRKDLKIVLMSATINQELFAGYFGGAPAIEIPGFTHPVQDYYLEDIIQKTGYISRLPMPKQDRDEDEKGQRWAKWQVELLDKGYNEQTVNTLARYRNQEKIDYDLIAQIVRYIAESGKTRIDNGSQAAMLIFMPGAMEIRRCVETLQQQVKGIDQKFEILPLHANLSPQEQTRVFKAVPDDVIKVVVATNVAETSITIDGIVYVIDAGRVKETQYDPSNSMMRLVETWASRASCRQRRGRAGRTRPGECYKLFTRDLESTKMRSQQVPELLRTPLEQLCLQVKAMGEADVKAFLGDALDPPSTKALDSAIEALKAVDAIDDSSSGGLGELTPLGMHMASIPADLRISKMLLLGSILRCLDPILTIAAIMSLKSPFTSPMDRRDEARQCRERFAYGRSDWLTDMKAYDKWYQILKTEGIREARRFCEENYLSFSTLSEISNLRRQYGDALLEIGFYHKGREDEYNEHSKNTNLVKSVVFAGLNPNVARIQMPDSKYDKVLSGTVEREKEAKEIKFYTQKDGRVFLHPSSILFSNNSYAPGSFLTYFSRMQTSKIFIRDGTEVPSYAVLFFGGRVDIDHLGRGLRVGQEGWIKFRAWARIGVLVNQLKRLLQAELNIKIQDPSTEGEVVQAMISLITNNGV
ncbi:P-loop containing nucleoside triphosphate hydrolase protein [Dichotomocladium elegans]|nr:P-loop containing nucleoside triphosphate hydrolase protein [Dichotomocladium elegans]